MQETIELLITVVHIFVAFFMILVVLVQGGNSGGMGAALGGGGGNSTGVFGATGATSLLGKLTYAAAIIFMLTSLSLSIAKTGSENNGLINKLSDAPAASGGLGVAPEPSPVPQAEKVPQAESAPAATTTESQPGMTTPDEAKPAEQKPSTDQ